MIQLRRPVHHFIVLFVLCSAALIFSSLSSCSSGRKLTVQEKNPLHKADSLFQAGKYHRAQAAYSTARDTLVDEEYIRDAQYKLAILHLYHDNADVNLDSSLIELKYFVTLFPDDPRAGEAKSWIKVLNLLKKTRKELKAKNRRIRRLNRYDEQLAKTTREIIDSLTETLDVLQQERDSLFDDNAQLKQIIVELERKCQQGGR
ncbi:MAG: hypothetical protein ACLFQB_08810 [Chitinispirillaceae bacterium]